MIFSLKNYQKPYLTFYKIYIEGKSLACNYMKNEKANSLICFYFYFSSQLKNDGTYSYYTTITFFDINENEINTPNDNNVLTYSFGNHKYMKSTVNIDHSIAFVCAVPYDGLNRCPRFLYNSKANIFNEHRWS